MTNLVPLFIDKQTGDIIATGSPGNNNGIGNPNDGFEFIQASPLDTWIVTHNKNNKKLLVQVYDLNNEFILPNKIKIINNNVVRVEFNTAITGIVKIAFF